MTENHQEPDDETVPTPPFMYCPYCAEDALTGVDLAYSAVFGAVIGGGVAITAYLVLIELAAFIRLVIKDDFLRGAFIAVIVMSSLLTVIFFAVQQWAKAALIKQRVYR